jgi:hypothetical protein
VLRRRQCLASLYSCGSVSGLLSSVLPGARGWFGKLATIAETQWRQDWIDTPSKRSLLEWRLPKRPPKLLPFLVNNYGTEYKAAAEGLAAAKRVTRGAGPEALATVKQIRFGASEIIACGLTAFCVCTSNRMHACSPVDVCDCPHVSATVHMCVFATTWG